jgi:hypothetical protein
VLSAMGERRPLLLYIMTKVPKQWKQKKKSCNFQRINLVTWEGLGTRAAPVSPTHPWKREGNGTKLQFQKVMVLLWMLSVPTCVPSTPHCPRLRHSNLMAFRHHIWNSGWRLS